MDTDRQPGKQEERAESVLQEPAAAYINVLPNKSLVVVNNNGIPLSFKICIFLKVSNFRHTYTQKLFAMNLTRVNDVLMLCFVFMEFHFCENYDFADN